MATGSAEAAEANFAALTRRVNNIEENISNIITTRLAVLEIFIVLCLLKQL